MAILLALVVWPPSAPAVVADRLDDRLYLWHRDPDVTPTTVLLWLAAAGRDRRTQIEWLARSDLPARGVVLACPFPAGRRWRHLPDRPHILRLGRALCDRFDLPWDGIILAGHRDGAAEAERIALDLPARAAAVVMIAGVDPVPDPPSHDDRSTRWWLHIDDDDPHVPLAPCLRLRDRIVGWGYPVQVDRGRHGGELGPHVWALLARAIEKPSPPSQAEP